jgi:hypothetical protein
MNSNFNTTMMGKFLNDDFDKDVIKMNIPTSRPPLTVQAIFENTTLTLAQGATLSAGSASPTIDDVIFYGNTTSTSTHPGNQLFTLLIQRCVKRLPQGTHNTEDVAQAFWECHKPRHFFEWNNDSARYSLLSPSDTLHIIQYALNEEKRLATLRKSEQENLNLFAITLDEVDGTEGERIVIDDAVAYTLKGVLPYASRHYMSDAANQPTDTSHFEFHNHPPEGLDLRLTEHTESQEDLVQRLVDHNKQGQENANQTGLPPDSRHYMSDDANQPTYGSRSIDESPQGCVRFTGSKINSRDYPKDARSEQATFYRIAVGSFLHLHVQALQGLLLIQAFLQIAGNTFKKKLPKPAAAVRWCLAV